ncbi:unnamed protein product [Ectocarpus sp. 4 AP-2014]
MGDEESPRLYGRSAHNGIVRKSASQRGYIFTQLRQRQQQQQQQHPKQRYPVVVDIARRSRFAFGHKNKNKNKNRKHKNNASDGRVAGTHRRVTERSAERSCPGLPRAA